MHSESHGVNEQSGKQSSWGNKESSDDIPYSDSDQELGQTGTGIGAESERIHRASRPGDDTDSSTGDKTAGKILSQLRSLQEAHLAYVNAHGERLEARLRENQEHKLKVIEEMRELEAEVLKLLEAEKPSDSPVQE